MIKDVLDYIQYILPKEILENKNTLLYPVHGTLTMFHFQLSLVSGQIQI
jgi:hypothetical protein